MKKRLIVVLSSLTVVLASFAVSLFAYRTNEMFEANLDALASFIVVYDVECFSQSQADYDFDYYDCGGCKKVEHRKGYGDGLICTYYSRVNSE